VFDNGDQVIEVGGSGGNQNSLSLTNFLGFVDTGWTLDETTNYIKATLDSNEASPNGLFYERDFLKILAYADVDINDNTTSFELSTSSINSIVRDLDMYLDVSVGQTTDIRNWHYIRYTANILTSPVDISTVGFSDLSSSSADWNYKDSGFLLFTNTDVRDVTRLAENVTAKIELNDITTGSGPWYGVVLTASIVTIRRITTGDISTNSGTFAKFHKTKPAPNDTETDPVFIFNAGDIT